MLSCVCCCPCETLVVWTLMRDPSWVITTVIATALIMPTPLLCSGLNTQVPASIGVPAAKAEQLRPIANNNVMSLVILTSMRNIAAKPKPSSTPEGQAGCRSPGELTQGRLATVRPQRPDEC